MANQFITVMECRNWAKFLEAYVENFSSDDQLTIMAGITATFNGKVMNGDTNADYWVRRNVGRMVAIIRNFADTDERRNLLDTLDNFL
uniref:Uncharacterized protein n=1 Tax=Panagrolaimus superbus TaxID=310955 RepID=A0A914XVD0_9BILA